MWSRLVVTIVRPSGLKAALVTGASWRKVRRGFEDPTRQSLALPSDGNSGAGGHSLNGGCHRCGRDSG